MEYEYVEYICILYYYIYRCLGTSPHSKGSLYHDVLFWLNVALLSYTHSLRFRVQSSNINSEDRGLDSDNRYNHNQQQQQCQEEEDSEEEEEGDLQVYLLSIKGIIWKQWQRHISMVGCCIQ